MSWSRFGGLSAFWLSVLSFVCVIVLSFLVFLVEESSLAAKRPFDSVVADVIVPLLIAFFVVLFTLVLRGVGRVSLSDEEYYQFCIDELDRFRSSIDMLIENAENLRSDEFSASARLHLHSSSKLFKKILNGHRRSQVLSHARWSAIRISESLLNENPSVSLAKTRVAELISEEPSSSSLIKEVVSAMDSRILRGHLVDA